MHQFNESILHDPSLSGIGNFLLKSSDLICLSHLQWDVVHQHPHHLLNHCQQRRSVFFVEEPVVEFISSWWLEMTQREYGVWVVVPHLPNWVNDQLATAMHQSLIDELLETYAIANPILWYYTPAALAFTKHLPASAIVYECIDGFSPLQGASSALQDLERELLQQADVVFTGGHTIDEAQQRLHVSIRPPTTSKTSLEPSTSLSTYDRN
jgi:hypothetical protein